MLVDVVPDMYATGTSLYSHKLAPLCSWMHEDMLLYAVRSMAQKRLQPSAEEDIVPLLSSQHVVRTDA